jgi:hypothetical protein
LWQKYFITDCYHLTCPHKWVGVLQRRPVASGKGPPFTSIMYLSLLSICHLNFFLLFLLLVSLQSFSSYLYSYSQMIQFSTNSVYCCNHLFLSYILLSQWTLARFFSLQVRVLYTSHCCFIFESIKFGTSPDTVLPTVPPYFSSYELLHLDRWTWQI